MTDITSKQYRITNGSDQDVTLAHGAVVAAGESTILKYAIYNQSVRWIESVPGVTVEEITNDDTSGLPQDPADGGEASAEVWAEGDAPIEEADDGGSKPKRSRSKS